jgi:hypothetical protein
MWFFTILHILGNIYNIWWENYNKFHLQQKNLLGCCIVFWENSNNGSQNQARKLLSVIRNLPSRYLRRYEVYMLRRYLRSLQQNYIKLHQVYNMQATFEGIILHILFNITTGHDFAYSSIYVWWQVEKHSNYLLCAEYNLDLQMNELSFPYKFQGLLTRLSSIHGSRNVVTLFALWTYAFRCIKILVNS